MPLYRPSFRNALGFIPVLGSWLSNPNFARKAKNLNGALRLALCIPGVSNLAAGCLTAAVAYKTSQSIGKSISGFFAGAVLGVDNGIDMVVSTQSFPPKSVEQYGSPSNILLHLGGRSHKSAAAIIDTDTSRRQTTALSSVEQSVSSHKRGFFTGNSKSPVVKAKNSGTEHEHAKDVVSRFA